MSETAQLRRMVKRLADMLDDEVCARHKYRASQYYDVVQDARDLLETTVDARSDSTIVAVYLIVADGRASAIGHAEGRCWARDLR